MIKKIADKIEEIFRKVPIDQYLEDNVDKLPKDLPLEIKQKLLNNSKFFAEYGIKTDTPEDFAKMLKRFHKKPKALKDINKDMSNKKAYPNYDPYMSYKTQSNTNKWVDTVKEMYHQVHKGASKEKVLSEIISGWDDMEKLEFKNWLKFYEENAHNKYSEVKNNLEQLKVAQIGFWEDVNRAAYFVPTNNNAPRVQEMDLAKNPKTNEGIKSDEKRQIIEAQRNKIVSRLDSAEKLLRSHDGQIFAGDEFETLMHIIYELKKKIHTVNKISTATKLYEDMIVREANILNKKGFKKASDVLFKIAGDVAIAPTPPANPTSSGGLPGTLPGEAPGQVSPPNNLIVPDNSKGMKNFLDGLSGEKDQHSSDDIEVIEDADNNLVVEAQQAAPAKDENIEVSEEPQKQKSNIDQKMDQAFVGLKVEDVIQKLEDLTSIYKNREMSRQLTQIDMMLNYLGMATFFPELSEAINRSFEGNNYILIRIEQITSRLRGVIKSNSIDLQSNQINNPETKQIQEKLQNQENKEKQQKQMRKDLENKALEQENKPEPTLEVEEDLNTPAAKTNAIPAPPPVPIK